MQKWAPSSQNQHDFTFTCVLVQTTTMQKEEGKPTEEHLLLSIATLSHQQNIKRDGVRFLGGDEDRYQSRRDATWYRQASLLLMQML